MEQRGDSPVLVMHDGVTKSTFAHLIPTNGVDFPSCEKVVKMIVKELDTLGYHRVEFRSDDEPSILSPLRAVKMACKTSAEGDLQSNGAAESSVNADMSDRSNWQGSQLRVSKCQQTMIC